ncbi:MAG: GNAT family N-acetyltransferase [Verrucomicrobiota bacterium]
MRLIEVEGPGLGPWIPALGGLRIKVFREFPYLYDGDEAYEREYLSVYLRSPRSLAVLALDAEGRPVGATTCLPLEDEQEAFRAPFTSAGLNPADFRYLAESVVLPEHRGRGLGREFFTRREAHARRLGRNRTTFCSVDRPADHPARPTAWKPLDAFWSGLGYVRRPELRAVFPWKELGETQESPKTLTFWTRSWHD